MYQVASTSVAAGLNPGFAILAVFIGHTLVCIPAMLDSYVGAKLGINFPVYCRSAFGMRGSYIAVFIRGIVAVIWFGVTKSLILGYWAVLIPSRNTILPRRPMPRSNDLRHLALLQQLPQPHPRELPCHLCRAPLLFPLHHHPTAPSLPPRHNSTIHVHAQNDHHAHIRPHALHLGSCHCRGIWSDV